jgi:putative MFS transporter
MAASFGRIGGILGPLLVGYMSTQGTSLTVTFSIFCAAILIGVISVVFLGKETKQKQLA